MVIKRLAAALTMITILSVVIYSCGTTRSSGADEIQDPQDTFHVNRDGKGYAIEVDFKKGPSFYYPLMAIWLEDMEGKYIETLYVPQSVATGIFEYGRREVSGWLRAPRRAPQSVPYWAHKRGVKASDGLYMPEPDNPVADAYTGATPKSGFVMKGRSDNKPEPPFRVLFEINQNWDWNRYWTNDKYPGDEYYLNSAQPALVYEAVIESYRLGERVTMKPIGHSHPSGTSGELFPDISTLTTAIEIAESVTVIVREE
jgi:hypothetical protein